MSDDIAKTPVTAELEPGTYHWCKCGKSAKQPLCDGAHKGSGIAPVAFTVTEKRPRAYCRCKRTNNIPFCDGSHAKA